MSSRRVFLLSVWLACTAAIVGAQACATEGELNPQPLPPGDDKGEGDNGGSLGGDPSSPGASADAAVPTTDPGCGDAGVDVDATVDDDGGETGALTHSDASCGDGG